MLPTSQNTPGDRDQAHLGAHRVYAVCWEHKGNVQDVFCYGNGFFGSLPPSRRRYPGARTDTSIEMYRESDWLAV